MQRALGYCVSSVARYHIFLKRECEEDRNSVAPGVFTSQKYEYPIFVSKKGSDLRINALCGKVLMNQTSPDTDYAFQCDKTCKQGFSVPWGRLDFPLHADPAMRKTRVL